MRVCETTAKCSAKDPSAVNLADFKVPLRLTAVKDARQQAAEDANLPPGFPKRVTKDNMQRMQAKLSAAQWMGSTDTPTEMQ